MLKRGFVLLLLLWCWGAYGQCCEKFLSLGRARMAAKDYAKAKYYFEKGLQCGNAARCADLKKWAAQAQAALTPAEQPTPESPKPKPVFKPSGLAFEPEMVFVEGGTFQMGNNTHEDEKPVHSVTVSNFWMGKYEVTQAQWRGVMGSDPPELRFKGCDDCPVEGVSWEDVQEFIRKLNHLTGKRYRLPTEAEWEYAARGGNSSKRFEYSGDNEIATVAWCYGQSGGATHPVGKKKGNELDIFDMSGNVWEWCGDKFGSYGGATEVVKGATPERVLRGGGWDSSASDCRVSYRSSYMPTLRFNDLGFRLVCLSQ